MRELHSHGGSAGAVMSGKKVGIQIFPWTVNQPDDISRMIDLGVDGIITDFPERIIKK